MYVLAAVTAKMLTNRGDRPLLNNVRKRTATLSFVSPHRAGATLERISWYFQFLEDVTPSRARPFVEDADTFSLLSSFDALHVRRAQMTSPSTTSLR